MPPDHCKFILLFIKIVIDSFRRTDPFGSSAGYPVFEYKTHQHTLYHNRILEYMQEKTKAVPAVQASKQPAETAAPAKEKEYDWEFIFDAFLATLTKEQRKEFVPLFALVPASRLPKYQIGGDNRFFFLMFFIYLGHVRTTVSNGLMHKIYKFTASLYA